MEKINIADLLRDCPKGMELDCMIYDNIVFDGIQDWVHPIRVVTKDGEKHLNLTKYGCTSENKNAKCIIFPKGKTTWEGFVPPCKFKDGDILYAIDEGNEYIFILKHIFEHGRVYCYLNLKGDDLRIQEVWLTDYNHTHRLATAEEKRKLFQAIKDNGYRWNPETKTLDKLIKPEFKVWDKIRLKNDKTRIETINYIYSDSYGLCSNHLLFFKEQDEWELVPVEPRFKVGDRVKSMYNNSQYDIKELTDTHYTLVEVINKFKYTEPIIEDKNWELVPNKFDITTLKRLESKVLVRDYANQVWTLTFWGERIEDNPNCSYLTTKGCHKYCIPYEGNEHLLNTSNEPDDFYKTWENEATGLDDYE